MVYEQIEQMFAARGDCEYYGEAISQSEHALQSAQLAVEARAADSLVIAALLHDIGHLLHNEGEDAADRGIDTRHEDDGEAWLSKWFGPEVSVPVKLHVDAKRYLCAINPGYLAGLSPASVKSLELQGGPFDDAGVHAFEANPFFQDAVRLRAWDDTAKVVGMETPPLNAYKDRIDSLARG